MFKAKISTIENRFDTVDVGVDFLDGDKTIHKDYNFHTKEQIAGITEFVKGELDKLNNFYSDIEEAKSLIGNEIE